MTVHIATLKTHPFQMHVNLAQLKVAFLSAFSGFLLPAVIVPLHIYTLTYFWSRYSRNVDKRQCSCSCWDTVFKGPYETGVAAYKHMYFNATSSTCKMWILTTLAVVSLYESIKRLVRLALQKRLRFSMAFLFLSTLFSHYYSWWSFVNYWNDDFYSQWYHQVFFSITELISSGILLFLANSYNYVSPRMMAIVCGVAACHTMAACSDQFIENVFNGKGQAHQVVRDLFLMTPDLLNLGISSTILIHGAWKKRKTLPANRLREHATEMVAMLLLVFIGFTIISLL